MIVIGAGGFASELLQILKDEAVFFFDNVSRPAKTLFLDRHPILSTEEQLKKELAKNPAFVLGLGRPEHRLGLTNYVEALGGQLHSVLSRNTSIGTIGVETGAGVTILDGVRISNKVQIGKGSLLYYNVVVTHDCTIGEFCELSPGATLLGNVQVGDLTHIGANATVLPRVKIGKNCIIGAGAVVTKDVPDNSIAMGVPARFQQRDHS